MGLLLVARTLRGFVEEGEVGFVAVGVNIAAVDAGLDCAVRFVGVSAVGELALHDQRDELYEIGLQFASRND
jgi:hypothetical protein